MVKEIPLTQGQVALVDDEDYELVSQYKWHFSRKGKVCYACSNVSSEKIESDGYIRTRSMHKLITGYEQTDHKNGNGLDNRRENLRAVTRTQNRMNQRKANILASSIYKGVSWKKVRKDWQVQIRVNGKQVYIGYFDSEIVAAKAYDEAARVYHGVFGTYNFPREGERSAI